jgi:transposase-like protein
VERVVIVLVELGVVELRYAAVLEVINEAASVTDVAFRYGVTRQTVHRWLRRYATDGLAGLADGSAAPLSCPHQMSVEVEARIVELRRLQPGCGPRTIWFRLEAEQVVPLPSRSSIYRCLVRHQLIVPEARRRKKGDYRRWERSRSMELWQMDIVGGVRLVNGWKASIVGHDIRRGQDGLVGGRRAPRSREVGFEHLIEHGHARPLRVRDEAIKVRIGDVGEMVVRSIHAQRPRDQHRDVVVDAHVDVAIALLGAECGTHVRVEVRDVDASGERCVDLRTPLGLDRFGVNVRSRVGDAVPQVPVIVDKAG